WTASRWKSRRTRSTKSTSAPSATAWATSSSTTSTPTISRRWARCCGKAEDSKGQSTSLTAFYGGRDARGGTTPVPFWTGGDFLWLGHAGGLLGQPKQQGRVARAAPGLTLNARAAAL